MAEHEESLMEKIVGTIHDHDGSNDDQKSHNYRKKTVHKVFGGGKPADVILWRNKKTSAIVLGSATALWILFELLEYPLITLVCHLLMFSLAMLFLWSNASTFINKSPPKIPEVVLPENCLLEAASALRIEINKVLDVAREVASGRDLKTFLCAVTGLWILSIVGNWFNFLTLFYMVFVLLHTLPYFYEKHEDRVDLLAEKAMIEMKKQYIVLDEKLLSKMPAVQQFMGQLKDKKRE